MLKKIRNFIEYICIIFAILRAAQGLGMLVADLLDELVYQIKRRKNPDITRFQSKY